MEEQQQHEQRPRAGALILAAPGAGKSTWVAQQRTWIDADTWASAADLHDLAWHETTHTSADEQAHYRAIDSALMDARSAGMCVVGSLFWALIPDAIVVIPTAEHRRRVSMRSDLKWEAVVRVSEALQAIAREHGVPTFSEFEAAAAAIADAA